MSSAKRLTVWAAVAAVAITAAGFLPIMGSLARQQADGAVVAEDTKALEGKPAPEVSLKTLDGGTFKLSANKGKVVLMDNWATWCPPCRKGLPHLDELAKDAALKGKGLVVVGINAAEDKALVEGFMKENSYSFTVPMDANKEFGKSYKVVGIPTTVVVGRDGKVKTVFIGFGNGTEKEIKAAVEKALEEKVTE